MSNTFGKLFSLTTFGESHGPAIGGVIDGCPAGIPFDEAYVQKALQRRRPGQNALTTARNEADKVTFLSGIYKGATTGAPIGFIIENCDTRSEDYERLSKIYRPCHADFTYAQKYNFNNDPRGGGRSSARETASWVVGGAIAEQVLKKIQPKLDIVAFTSTIGNITVNETPEGVNRDIIDKNSVRCPDTKAAAEMEQLLAQVKADCDSVGGVVTCIIRNCPVGLGQPVFDKINSRLAQAMMSINGAKAIEFGTGSDFSRKLGSEVMDTWIPDELDIRGLRTLTNHSGGIQGGITNGESVIFKVTFKPIATIMRPIKTVDRDNIVTEVLPSGRHDVCIVPRAVPVVEAMTAMVILDMVLLQNAMR